MSTYATFEQIVRGPVWDGNLVSKDQRDRLMEAGLIRRGYGFNYLSDLGVSVAHALGLINRAHEGGIFTDVQMKLWADTIKKGV